MDVAKEKKVEKKEMADAEAALMQKVPLVQCPPDVRSGFVRKVYALVALQLAATAAIASTVVFVPKAHEWVVIHPEMSYVAMIVSSKKASRS